MTDKRKKGCPNKNCTQYEKVKMPAEYNVCPICGAELVYICSKPKCFNEIEDRGPSYKICRACELDAQERRDKAKEKLQGGAKKAAAAAAVAGVGIAADIGKAVWKDGRKNIVKAGAAAAKGAVKIVFKGKI